MAPPEADAASAWLESRRVQPSGRATTQDTSTDPGSVLAARRAQLMGVAGRVLEPLAHALRVQPEALAPNNAWARHRPRGSSARRSSGERRRRRGDGSPPSALFATAAMVDDIPFVADLRDLWAGNPYYDRGSPMLARLQGRALARRQAVVTVTDGCRANLLRSCIPELGQRLRVLPNGFDPALLARGCRKAPGHRGAGVALHAGALYGEQHRGGARRGRRPHPGLRGAGASSWSA